MPWKKGNRLRAVSERDAPPDIEALYREIRQKLGVPHVNVLFQVYAAYPGFLALHWNMFRPIVESGEYFRVADRLRADAYTRAHNYFEISSLRPQLEALQFSEDAKADLGGVIELFLYNDPLLLLILAAQQQAFDGSVGSGCSALLPPTPNRFETAPVLVDENSAEANVRVVFEQIRHVHGVPVLSQDFRALARFPDFLRIFWESLQPLLASPVYRVCQSGITESAWSLARELPGTIEMTPEQLTAAGMSEDNIASVVRLTQAFTRGLSSSLLNISIAKIGIEGGNQIEAVRKGRATSVTAREKMPNQAA
jgi:hypothetical protein